MNQIIATELGIPDQDVAAIARLNQQYVQARTLDDEKGQCVVLEQLQEFYVKYPDKVPEIAGIFSGPDKPSY